MAPRAWPALVLALSLVLSQTLGLLHRTVHAPATLQGNQAQVVVKNNAGRTSEAGRFIVSLVPKHDNAQGCDAFDQLSLGNALAGDLGAAICVPAAASPEPVLRGFHLATDESKHDFQARAPPVTGMS
jgi:hypothetical protein